MIYESERKMTYKEQEAYDLGYSNGKHTAMCSPWVKTSDRLPTREDANKDLRVLAKVANDGTVKGVRFEELSWIELGGAYYFSHWMKLPEVEG